MRRVRSELSCGSDAGGSAAFCKPNIGIATWSAIAPSTGSACSCSRSSDLPDRNTMASTPSNPAYFSVLLERRWAEGITKVRHLLDEIRRRGYTGSFTHLARFLSPWRSGQPSLEGVEQEEPAPIRVRTLDPMTGRVISPLTAAALCVKPRGQMTARQVANVVPRQ